jgi:hypothetical protein
MHAILRLPDVKRSSRKLVFELSNYLRGIGVTASERLSFKQAQDQLKASELFHERRNHSRSISAVAERSAARRLSGS